MPWKETCPMEQRHAFVTAWLSRRFTFTTLCRRFAVSRKTGYKWLRRFREGGEGALGERSRAAHHHPNRTPAELVERLLAAKHAYPDWGPVTLIGWLKRNEPQHNWPAPSTAGEILKRHGLVTARTARRRTPPHSEPLRHVHGVHDVWSADFKGHFALGNGHRCHPFTLSDNHSRYLIDCQGMPHPTLAPVKQRFERAFRCHGLPRAIRTDNGFPFASTALGGLTELSVWLLRLGITPERIAPGHPEHNPRHERMHRTLKRATASPPKADLRSQQRAFNRFRELYNHQRPHQALGPTTCPGDLFHTSPRAFPEQLPEPHYPEHFLVRRVRSNGEIKLRGLLLYLATPLAHELIGLEPLDQELYQLHFATLTLGILDARTASIIRPNGTWTRP